ncbi:multidrug effflux MFS transporter [Corynebacterium occultum]|uniref:multidrug effflux MFS transporter n=1 Tax=Corynebacterium occultum TaxID=2675219 RepID=UPI001E30DE80|nr:multidrug effflux MFS transporter [Corynebacterium occultum]
MNDPRGEEAGKPRQHLGTGLLIGLATLSAAAPLSTDMYLPALPNIVNELDTTQAMVQLTLSGFMLGMAVGQLIIGPISDATGRKKLLVGGAVIALFAAVVAALSPSVEMLVFSRVLQGLGSGACIVISRAVVPDLAVGKKAAKAFALLMMIQGVAPVLAPVVGGLLLSSIGWRGIFWVLAGISVVQLLISLFVVRESLPPENRSELSIAGVFANYLYVLRKGAYRGYLVSFSFGFATLFCYISAAPFVVQNQMGLSVTAFTLIFAGNSLGLMAANIINSRLIDRFEVHSILRVGQLLLIFFTIMLLIAVQFTISPWVILPPLFFSVACLAIVMGNSTALGTGVVRERAGSGSAVMGFAQFGLAGLVSPIMGLGGNPVLIMASGMVVCALVSFAGQVYAGARRG